MTLRASLLRELVNPKLSVGRRAELCCEFAKDFENRGEYDEACEVMSVFWPGIGERPALEGLDQSATAEVLMRVGVLTGLIGSSRQVADAQEIAKNLIRESLAIFQSQRYRKKVAEAQIELALCHLRTGNYNEAADLLNLALAQLFVSELKGKAVVRLAIIDIETDRFTEGLELLTDNASLFENINNDTLKGCYHQALGDVLEHLWESEGSSDYLDRALVDYAAASYHFEQSEHKQYLANVENNLGLIYFQINQCKDAHDHLNRARRIFTSLKDNGATAQVDETRARVLLQEGRYSDAEKVARASVRTLEKSDMQLPLVESLTTHGTALARLGNYGTALSAFKRAIDLSRQIGCLSLVGRAAAAAFQEIGEHLAIQGEGSFISGRTLKEEVLSLEHDLIKHALAANEGSVTRAAKTLGISYQELHYMLETRHRDLSHLRTPVRRRPRKS